MQFLFLSLSQSFSTWIDNPLFCFTKPFSKRPNPFSKKKEKAIPHWVTDRWGPLSTIHLWAPPSSHCSDQLFLILPSMGSQRRGEKKKKRERETPAVRPPPLNLLRFAPRLGEIGCRWGGGGGATNPLRPPRRGDLGSTRRGRGADAGEPAGGAPGGGAAAGSFGGGGGGGGGGGWGWSRRWSGGAWRGERAATRGADEGPPRGARDARRPRPPPRAGLLRRRRARRHGLHRRLPLRLRLLVRPLELPWILFTPLCLVPLSYQIFALLGLKLVCVVSLVFGTEMVVLLI